MIKKVRSETEICLNNDDKDLIIHVHNHFTVQAEMPKEADMKVKETNSPVLPDQPDKLEPCMIINRGTGLVELFGEPFIFTANQLRILCCLAENKGNYVRKSQLYAISVDDHAETGNNSALKSQIQKIRKKLGRHQVKHQIIQCYPRLGYRLNSKLTVKII